MKTIEQIKQQIADIQKAWPQRPQSNDEKSKKQYAKDADRARYLYEIQIYLETNPTEEFVRSEIQTLEAKLERIEEGYQDWKKCWLQQPKDPESEKATKTKFYKEMDAPKIRKSIKNP